MPTPRVEFCVGTLGGLRSAVGTTHGTVEMVQFGVAAVAGRLYAVGGNDFQGYLKEYQP